MTQLAMFSSAEPRPFEPTCLSAAALNFIRPEGDEIEFDYFAGGGGASEGFRMALGRDPAEAVNHNAEALAIHEANHPGTRHHKESVWKIDPVKIADGRPIGAAWFSPDCTDFSKAKGGKPVRKKIRGLAWVVVRVATHCRPRVIFLENVEEFQGWGPLIKGTDKRDPERAGETFRAFVRKLRRLGYEVEWKELRGCDYGAPTTRKRLFLIARCDGDPIVWPKATHGPGRAHAVRTAADCIDWSIPCPSIFLTKEEARAIGLSRIKRPLVENTLRRVARGVWKFVIRNPKPFIVPMQHSNRPVELDEPLQTVTNQGNKFNLVVPFVAGVGGRKGQSPETGVDRPYHTITSKADSAIITPFVVPVTHAGDSRVNSIEQPMPTITGAHRGEHAFIAPTLIQTGYGEDKKRNAGAGQPPRALDIEQPLGTIVGGGGKHALCASFLAKHFGGHETPGSQLDAPIDTVTETDHHALVAAHISKFYGDRVGSAADAPLDTVMATSAKHAVVAAHIQRDFGKSVGAQADAPLPTITGGASGHAALVTSSILKQPVDEPLHTVQSSGNHYAEVRAFLTKYYRSEENGQRLDMPMHTVTPDDRFGLVTVHGVDYAIVDIGMRMLVPRELARAQGFRDTYVLDLMIATTIRVKVKGKWVEKVVEKPLSQEAKTSMIGNSVNPQLAAALVSANYRPMRVRKERVA